ncbi:ATP-binding protein [Reichenbachiella sp. MALMAid0571]|uniref:ATP-binding protein n=1 Tax=Reichenbachiella sp. MALMAid0571 TaxID=3143939 RepID=UPI0032DEF720
MEKSSDSPSIKLLKDKINQLERRIERERKARKNAEKILESKSLQLYSSNQTLELVNKQLENQLERNKQFIQAINDFSGYLVGKSNLQEIASIITEKLISKYDLEDCTIYKVADGYCYQISAFGSKGNDLNEKIKVGDGIVGNVAKTGLAEILSDTSTYNPYITKHRDDIRLSELAVPIKFEESVIGIIETGHSQRDFFNRNHLKTITTISSLISVIFKNSLTEQINLNLESRIEKRTEITNSLIHNLHSGLLLNDEYGKIVLINDAFRKTFKFNIPNSEIFGKDQRESANLVKHLFKNPQGFIDIVDHCRKHNENVSKYELEMVDGTILDCDFIPIYSKDEFVGQMWQVTDVTSSRAYQKKVQASEEKYRGIIENMELGLLEVDLEHRILKAYEWFCRMTGYDEKELIGKDARKVFFLDKYMKFMDQQDALRLKGEQSIYEVQMRKKNGELIWVLISGAPFYDQNGKIAGTIGIHYNIDSRKKLEEDLKLSKLQTERAREAEKQFLANMSHEIRNPLNAIIGITNLLYDTKPTNEQLNHLNKIKYSSDILLGLISGVLDISKIESGTLELTEKEINISEVVNGLIQIAGFNTRDKNIKYENKLISSDEFKAMADPTAINQIFLNLLNNATKFTEEGAITIDGKVIGSSRGYTNFEFRVSDTGIGIAPEKLDSIFDIFQQVDNETKLKYGGTGLGLNIVKRLVSMYGGEVRAESKVNEGTTIIFNLKLKGGARLKPIEKSVHYEFKETGSILVVEDNEINQYYLSGILNKWNIRHDIANNGFEALTMLEKNKYNLILMDIRMPGMDGYETTLRLRSMIQNPNCAIPIIALTASALIDEREKAMQAGMNYHLTKPYTEDDLGDALSKFRIIKKIESVETNDFQFSPELDFGNLGNYYQDNIERAYKMFQVFNRVIDEDFQKIKKSIQEENWDEVSSIAHKIKPNFAMVGLFDLSKMMEYYEKSKINIEIRSEITLNFPKLESDFNAGKLIIQRELTKMDKFMEK